MNACAPSLLDKLLDTASAGRKGVALRLSVEQAKDAVARDIEALLNAHRPFGADDLAGHPNAARSLLTLGLVDISAMSLASDRDRRRIGDAIRDALTLHDRRLTHVEVGVRELGAAAGLTFTIRARLRLKPHTEPVAFDAVLQPGSSRYRVGRADTRIATDPR